MVLKLDPGGGTRKWLLIERREVQAERVSFRGAVPHLSLGKAVAGQKSNVAVLFADVSDSTRLYESLGDTFAFGNVRAIISLLQAITEHCQGRVVKTIGDGLMCVFPTADLTSAAAGEMQVAVAQLPPIEGGRKLTIRIGYHFGPVILSGDDVFGDTVNVAARMASMAFAGQVLTTANTAASLSDTTRNWLRRVGALPVKGKSSEIDLYEQLWQVNRGPTEIVGRMSVPLPTDSQLKLIYRGQELPFQGIVQFGREPTDNLVVVTGPLISRVHAKIERRGDKFVLVDRSSNGTYVALGDYPEIRLHREELILHRRGMITFGQRASVPGAECVEFHCS